MAKQKSSKKFDFTRTIMVVGGGVGANFIMDTLQNKVTFFADKPELVPVTGLVIGLAGQMFAPVNLRPAFDGVIAVAGAEAAQSLIGTSLSGLLGLGAATQTRYPGAQDTLQTMNLKNINF